jgi:LmbE family N-acetylglucosaminyl deacetylase
MMQLNLGVGKEAPLEVLCLGAHSDDIEIGCGGTILRLIEEYPAARFHWVVFSARGVRRGEAERAAELFAGSHRIANLILKEFADGFLPYVGADLKSIFEELKETLKPDLIFTHQPHDAHQDHRLLCELTWNTFRNHFILEYEIPKYDGDLGRPSVFFPLSLSQCQTKTSNLIEAFESQRSKHWFQKSTFEGLMRLRGMECNAPSGYAEGFYCRKLVL